MGEKKRERKVWAQRDYVGDVKFRAAVWCFSQLNQHFLLIFSPKF
jgi:hypothetical protein